MGVGDPVPRVEAAQPGEFSEVAEKAGEAMAEEWAASGGVVAGATVVAAGRVGESTAAGTAAGTGVATAVETEAEAMAGRERVAGTEAETEEEATAEGAMG